MTPFNIDGTDEWVQVQIWDTLGQEKFYSLAPLFFRRSVGAFLVYDVSDLASFEALEKWHQQILKNTDNRVITMMIGNKKDKMKREVPYRMAAEYAKKNNFGLMEVSAKTGNGVKEAFARLITEVYHQLVGEENEAEQFDTGDVGDKKSKYATSLTGRDEVHKGSIVLSRGMHLGLQSTADFPNDENFYK